MSFKFSSKVIFIIDHLMWKKKHSNDKILLEITITICLFYKVIKLEIIRSLKHRKIYVV